MKPALVIETINALREFMREHGHEPSYRDLAEVLELASTSAVHYRITELARLGILPHRYCGKINCKRLPKEPKRIAAQLVLDVLDQ